MIKVCFISLYSYKLFHPEDERVLQFGGSEVQQYQLGKELLKDKNFEVSFIVGDFCGRQSKTERIRAENIDISLYKTVKCVKRIFLIDSILDFWKLYKAMRKIEADIYIIRGGGSLAGKVAILLKKIFKKKFIYSSAHNRDSNGDFFKHHGRIINWLFRYALTHADKIICQHQNQREAFKKNLNIEARIIKTIYPIEDESQIQNYESREFILWVSRLEKWKQPEIFVKLTKEFPNEKFLLITNSNTSDFKDNIGRLYNLEIKEGVAFEGINDYFKKAKIFVNTSIQEGFPNTFVQAAKNKTPIISLNINPEEMLEKYEIGRCANGDLQKFTDDLKEILNNEKLWQEMSENAYHYAKENHDIHKIMEKYKMIFREVISPR